MPDEETKLPSKIRFIYKKSDDYKQCFVNGAYGSFSPHGDFICDFFFEFKEIPPEQEARVDIKNDQLDYIKVESTDVPEYTREIRLGIIMSPQELIDLRDWLNKRIEDYTKSRG
ncbi:MAG: hypothetical protein A4E51_01448 [Methanosaeta sp. PtaU1.Bin055]|nr:MAG: hypothetical protein A4E51_01448 [Methanosaeta sp. PtaU1.Bin055]